MTDTTTPPEELTPDLGATLLATAANRAVEAIRAERDAALAELATVKAERDEARFSAMNARHAQRINEAGLLVKLEEARTHRITRDVYEGCCRAAVDSDGFAHDHVEWYADLIAAEQALVTVKGEADRLRARLAASEAREAAVRPVVEAAGAFVAKQRRLRLIEDTAGPLLRALIAAVDALPATAPKVWAMPSEPGPDVTRVRDTYGQCFSRADAIDENGSEPGWLGDAFTDEADVPDLFLSWKTLMAHHAPLTEVVDAPPTEEATNA